MDRCIGAMLVVAGLCLLSQGCTELKVYRVNSTESQANQVGTIPYYLARTAITTTGILTLKNCKTEMKDGKWRIHLDYDKTLVAIPSIEADPTYQFYIDYEEARTILKETNISIDTYPNKTLQAVSSTINDQAGLLAVATLTAVVNVAASVAVPGIHVSYINSTGQESKVSEYCSTQALNGPPLVKVEKDKMQAARTDILNAARDTSLTLVQYQKIVASQEQIISSAQAEITRLTGEFKLTKTITDKWIPSEKPVTVEQEFVSGEQRLSEIYEIDVLSVVSSWLSSEGLKWATGPSKDENALKLLVLSPIDASELKKGQADGREQFKLKLKLTIDTWSTGKDNRKAFEKIQPKDGIVIRDPALGILQLCKKGCVASQSKPAGKKGGAAEDGDETRLAVSIPQFGRILAFPQKSGLFQNSVLSLKMSADGTIASMGYKDASTAAAGLAGISAAAKDQISGITARNTAIGAQNTAIGAQNTIKQFEVQYPGIVNKALADCFANETAVIKAGGTPTPCQ